MGRVSSRALMVALLVLAIAVPGMADSGRNAPGLWAQFVIWINARIGIPHATTASDSISFEEWLVLMARIGIPH